VRNHRDAQKADPSLGVPQSRGGKEKRDTPFGMTPDSSLPIGETWNLAVAQVAFG
jgi:hypothetical protein